METEWMAAMRRGDFAAAWAIGEAVMAGRDPAGRDDPRLPYHLRWVWDGRDWRGRNVLVRCYHGLGDTLQFMRYLPALRREAVRVTLEVQPALLPLLANVDSADRVVPFAVDAPLPPSECDIEIMELPQVLRLSPEAVTRPPYLRPVADGTTGDGMIPADIRAGSFETVIAGINPAILPERGGRFKPGHDGRGRSGRMPFGTTPERAIPGGTVPTDGAVPTDGTVGLCWRTGNWDPDRAVPEALIRRLIEKASALRHRPLVTLQPDPTSLPVKNPGGGPSRIEDTAALVASLDLVITVDTMVAHLAGALNRPTWLLLKHEADWRWMAGRDDSPWYPSMRLYRQEAPGDWAGTIARIARDLTTAG